MPSHIAGSWFPTGFYGHFRNKSRSDFVCEYRLLAKPQPPEKFLKRSMQPRNSNVFSQHDNRNSYLSDARIFEQGLGRKRIRNSTYAFKPNFISWMPEKEYIEKMRPLTSTYHIDYKRATQNTAKQQLTERPRSSFDGTPTTTYRYSHCNLSPNYNIINAMNNEALQSAGCTKIQRSKARKPKVRETVATCLSWYTPPPAVNTPPPQMNSKSSEINEESDVKVENCVQTNAEQSE